MEFITRKTDYPEPLDMFNLMGLIAEAQAGDEIARQKVILHNMRLVFSIVYGKYSFIDYDKDDLVSVGTIGLIQAVDTFDISKELCFSTYAGKCIENALFKFWQKLKKYENVISLDKKITHLGEETEGTLMDTVADNENGFNKFEDEDDYNIVRKVVMDLQEPYKTILMLYYGFDLPKALNQYEIADKLNVSQAQICRNLSKGLSLVKFSLNHMGVINTREDYSKKYDESFKLKPFYSYFDNYSFDAIEKAMSYLDTDEIALLDKKYHGNYEHTPGCQFKMSERYIFYGRIIPKMNVFLNRLYPSYKNPNKKGLKYSEVFCQHLESLNPKAAMIVSLKVGLVNNKKYTTEQIAEHLKITEDEVRVIIRLALEAFRAKVNIELDDVIGAAIDEEYYYSR